MPCDPGEMWGMMGPALMILGVVVLVVLLALSLTALLWLLRQLRRVGGQPGADGAREALDRRYAAGEIGREDYLQARSDLGR